MSALRSTHPLLVVPALLFAGACSTLHTRSSAVDRAPGRTITAVQIERSGATDAWDAIRRSGTYLLVRQNSRGDQVRITHRGANSLLLSNEVLVVVDGIQLTDWSHLRDIPAEVISRIRLLSGPQATVEYGTPAGNGAVLIETQVPKRSE